MLWLAGRLPACAPSAPRSFPTVQQAETLLRLQQTAGNAAVAQRLARQVQLQKPGAEPVQAPPARTAARQAPITKGPQGVPAFWHDAGMGRRVLWHPGTAIGPNVIVDVFEASGRLMVAWLDFSRGRHEIRPLDLFGEWLSAGPGGQWEAKHGRTYRWLAEKVAPAEWYANRADPIGFVAKKLDELRPGGPEEKKAVEAVLAPAAYRALVKREALANLTESQRATRDLLSKGTRVFAAIARPWQRKAALEAEQARIRAAMAAPAAGLPRAGAESSQYDLDRIARELSAIEKSVAGLEKKQPLLEVMRKHGIPVSAKSIEDTLRKIDANIETTRAAVITNQLDPMALGELRGRVSRNYARFKTTLRGERPAAEAFDKEQLQRRFGLLFFDILIMVLSGGFSTALAALQTAGSVSRATVREAAALTSPSGPSVSSRKEADAAWWETRLAAAAAVLQGLSWAAEVRALFISRALSAHKRLALQQFKREALTLQQKVSDAVAQVERLQTRLQRLLQAEGAAGRVGAGERAGARAVLRHTERAARRLIADLRSELVRANRHAHALQKELRLLQKTEPERRRELFSQLEGQLQTLVDKWHALERRLDVLAKVVGF